ncbi:Glycerophosphoryl diester phosphodiesterase [Roseibacterium elongatum DSM 19469]|uniref:Glycerophosphoryl diester phosphodiesterase n=1 Tax=Roseicyclus elongatus DSM 19469 TaxID=1294273 RepID=W8S4Q3_9RHOB|nr:glycerophosphodiester phosphodiesterase family protein [Roseibacterium elongatum]AHM03796.1 Glycerophosphoryl diester phosphodiesterase [Roseibacterium elongatum DSM 19469]
MLIAPEFLKAPIAHRALHDMSQGIPENSLAAIRRAMRAGYGIEIDVQLSADGQAMVFHDDTLDRMTHASGPVRGRPARELCDLRLAGSEDHIPTLRHVLEVVGGQVPLLIELKDQSGGIGADDGALERAVAQDLAAYDGPAAVMSFNPYMIGVLREIAPAVPRGLVTCGFIPSKWPHLAAETCHALRSIRAFGQVGAGFISHDWTDLGSPRVAELKGQGTPVLCWTVTSPQVEAEARRVADNITFEGYVPPIPG